MSNSPESKNSITNPGATPNPAAGAIPPTSAAPAVNNPTVQSATLSANQTQAPSNHPQFKTENIGNWAAQQEGYFAEQNRKAEEKRKKSEQTRKKVMPFVFIIGGLIAAALIIWGVVALIIALTSKPEPEIPVIAGVTNEDISDYRDVLQDLFNKNGNNVDAVDNAVNNVLNTDEGKEYADQILMSQMSFLMSNNFYEEAAIVGEKINPDSLDPRQRSMLYSMLATIYANLNNYEKASEYNDLMYQTNLELGGDGGA